MSLEDELRSLQDLITSADNQFENRAYVPATWAQLLRIRESLNLIVNGDWLTGMPDAERIWLMAELCGYDRRFFVKTSQLNIASAGAVISWLFDINPHVQTDEPRPEAAEAVNHCVGLLRAFQATPEWKEYESRVKEARRPPKKKKKVPPRDPCDPCDPAFGKVPREKESIESFPEIGSQGAQGSQSHILSAAEKKHDRVPDSKETPLQPRKSRRAGSLHDRAVRAPVRPGRQSRYVAKAKEA